MIYILILFEIILNYGTGTSYALYFLTVPFLLLHSKRPIKIHISDIGALLFLFLWAYGILMGLIRNNALHNVIRNFFGMTIYSFYFILSWKDINKERIEKVIYIGSCITICQLLLAFLFMRIFGFSVYHNKFLYPFMGYVKGNTGNLNTARILIESVPSIFIFLAWNLYKLRSYHKYISKIIPICKILLCIFVISGIMRYKGYILGMFVILSIYIWVKLAKHITQKGTMLLTLLTVIIVGLTAALFPNLLKQSILFNVFSSADPGNSIRYFQIKNIVKELSFWGNGLGALFQNDLGRETSTYAVEIIYLNLFHKFGVFAVFLILNYLYTIYFGFKLIIKKINLKDGFFILGLMGYLFPALGNPILFGPKCVIFHCISMYLIKLNKKKMRTGIYNDPFSINNSVKLEWGKIYL